MSDPERWQRVQELFAAVLALPPEGRADLLADSDPAIRDEVASLLAALEEAEGFLETPVVGQRPREGAGEEDLSGRRLGPYRLLGRLGRGGMGVVYLAARADDQFSRRVAIKLLDPELADDEVGRRFRAERRILATLDHPNIGRLLDGGTSPEGLPYLVMEYVEGTAIDDYCTTHRLPMERRLELFLAVCEAVDHAHRNLVVHRDLKPSNILVTADGTVKLLDFGIAKLLNPHVAADSAVSLPGLRLLTPGHASPEQVRGEPVSTASDVYSLGVLLYRLLTDESPYAAVGTGCHGSCEGGA